MIVIALLLGLSQNTHVKNLSGITKNQGYLITFLSLSLKISRMKPMNFVDSVFGLENKNYKGEEKHDI